MNNSVNIDQVLYSNFIKYDVLNNLLDQARIPRMREVIVFIDMSSIVNQLYKQDVLITDYALVTSSIINMCAHYRAILDDPKRALRSTFVIVHSYNTPVYNSTQVQGYNNKYNMMINSNFKLTAMIEQNVELLKTLCPYLPDIHFVTTQWEAGVKIFHLMNAVDKEYPKIIISKDKYLYQLAALYNVRLLRPKKYKGEDYSYLVDSSNLYSTYLSQRTNKTDTVIPSFSPELFTLLLSLSSFPERDIKSVMNIRTAINKIQQGISNYTLMNAHCNPSGFFSGVNCKNASEDELLCRFKALDILSQYMVFAQIPLETNIDFKNLYDPNAVKEINEKYFKQNPLDLNRL